MKVKFPAALSFVAAFLCLIGIQSQARTPSGVAKFVRGEHYFVPKDGFVPNAKTAIRIAEVVWIPIYGQANIRRERPFRAELNRDKDRWVVTGSLPKGYTLGGVALAVIAKKDGRILRVSHGA